MRQLNNWFRTGKKQDRMLDDTRDVSDRKCENKEIDHPIKLAYN